MSAVYRIRAANEYTFRFTMQEGGRQSTVTFSCDASNTKNAWSKIVKEQQSLMNYVVKIELLGNK